MDETPSNSHNESSPSINIHESESRKSDDVAATNIGREYYVNETVDPTPGGGTDFEECPFERRTIFKESKNSLDDKRRDNPVEVVSTGKISSFQRKHGATDCTTKAKTKGRSRYVNLRRPINFNYSNESLQHATNEHKPTSEAIASVVTADVEVVPTSCGNLQEFVVEDSALVNIWDQPFVVVAKRVKDQNNRLLAILICLVISAVIATVTTVTLKLNWKEANSINDKPATYSPSVSSNTTIGESWASSAKSLTIVGFNSDVGELFFEILNRNDTFFTVVSFEIDVLNSDLTLDVVRLFPNPLWKDHVLNLLMHRIIEGQNLTFANIADGLVVKSMAGYPVTFYKHPNFTIDGIEVLNQDITFTNAVEHKLAHVPQTLVPWMYRTDYDVLLEVNEQRGGDLSDFIKLLNSSNLTSQLTMEVVDRPITLFVPTNEALSTIVTDNILDSNSRIHQLLLNHFVVGNFVINSWLRFPSGMAINNTKLQLTTQAGNVLSVLVGDKNVTINGNVHIIQKDVLSYTGVLHIVDLPLAT